MIEVTRGVLWGEMDAMGHVNNTVFFRYFEEARIALLAHIGLVAETPTGGPGPILATASCRFLRPLTYPDEVRCEAAVRAIGRTSFTVGYRLHSAAQRSCVAEGESVVVCFDYASGQKAPLPDAVRARLEALQVRE